MRPRCATRRRRQAILSSGSCIRFSPPGEASCSSLHTASINPLMLCYLHMCRLGDHWGNFAIKPNGYSLVLRADCRAALFDTHCGLYGWLSPPPSFSRERPTNHTMRLLRPVTFHRSQMARRRPNGAIGDFHKLLIRNMGISESIFQSHHHPTAPSHI